MARRVLIPAVQLDSGTFGSFHETLTLAGLPVPAADETKHIKTLGTTGTGKSTAIRDLLGGAPRLHARTSTISATFWSWLVRLRR